MPTWAQDAGVESRRIHSSCEEGAEGKGRSWVVPVNLWGCAPGR